MAPISGHALITLLSTDRLLSLQQVKLATSLTQGLVNLSNGYLWAVIPSPEVSLLLRYQFLS